MVTGATPTAWRARPRCSNGFGERPERWTSTPSSFSCLPHCSTTSASLPRAAETCLGKRLLPPRSSSTTASHLAARCCRISTSRPRLPRWRWSRSTCPASRWTPRWRRIHLRVVLTAPRSLTIRPGKLCSPSSAATRLRLPQRSSVFHSSSTHPRKSRCTTRERTRCAPAFPSISRRSISWSTAASMRRITGRQCWRRARPT